MKRFPLLTLLTLATAWFATSGRCAVKYWDVNGATAGSGQAGAGGTWNTTTANWTTDATGGSATTTFTSGDIAVFSAGADATGSWTLTAGVANGGITNEEGTITLSGSAVALGTGIWTIQSGAKVIIPGSSQFTASAGAMMVLDGGVIENTVVSSAGPSFMTAACGIFVTENGGFISALNTSGPTIIQTGTPGTIISGPGGITKIGGGILAIATANTYAGATTVSNGTLRVRATSNRLPTSTDLYVYSPGVFDPGSTTGIEQTVNSVNGDGAITYSAGSILRVTGAVDSAISGVISDGSAFGRIAKHGSGTLTLSAVNTYDGSFTNGAGTTTVTATGSLIGAGGDVVIHGGTVNLNNAAQSILSLSGTGGLLNLSSGHTLTVSPSSGTRLFTGKISGDAALVKSGAGNMALGGNNDYTGNTTVNSGRIRVDSANALGSTSGYTEVASGAEILFDGAAIEFTCSENFRIAGVGPDSGAIVVQNNANVILSGTITLTGDATNTVSGTGTVLYNNPDAITSVANQNLTLQGGSGAGGGGTISGAIALGTGGLTKRQGGRWILSGANTYTGPTAVTAGSLYVNSPGSLAAGSAVSVSTGALLGGDGTINGSVTVDGTLSPGASIGTLTLGVSPVVNGTLIMEIDKGATPNADKLVVNGAYTFSGTLTINNLGNTMSGGEVFDLFDAPSFDGAFAVLNLPLVNDGLNWWLGNLSVDGSIKVNRWPAGGDDTLSTPTNTPASITINKLKAKHPDADGDAVTLSLNGNTTAQGGSVGEAGGAITYTPPSAAFGGADSFTYTLNDGRGGVVIITVNVTVGGNDAPSPNVVSGPVIDGGDFVVRFAGIPGETYTVEHSISPLGPWSKLENKLAPTDNSLGFGIGVFEVREDIDGTEAGFYRTVHPAY